MGLLLKKKKLFEMDPKVLDLDSLSALQASCIAKLVLVNEELISRYKNVAEMGSDIPKAEDTKGHLIEIAEHLKNMNTILNLELSRITGEQG